MGKLYVVTTVAKHSHLEYIFNGIDDEKNVVVIPDFHLTKGKLRLFLRRVFYSLPFRIPLFMHYIWFEKQYVDMLHSMDADDSILFFDMINNTLVRGLKMIMPPAVNVNSYFCNPVVRIRTVRKRKPKLIIKQMKRQGVHIYSFDKGDSLKYCIDYAGQYLRFPSGSDLECGNNSDFFFCGLAKDRENILMNLKKQLSLYGFVCDFIIPHRKNEEINGSQYYQHAFSTRCIVDINQGNQEGMTRRVLEALFFNKKLLTNNKSIVNEPFYSPANVFIIKDDVNIKEITNFMNQPLDIIADSIKEQYDINSWLKRFY